MLKFTCFVFCAAAVSLRSNYVAATDEDLESLTEKCTKEYGITRAEINAAAVSGNLSGINPCYWSCYFKKIGILNDKGQYDLDTGLAFYRKYMEDAAYAVMEKVVKQCESVKDEAVKDGEAGCERGTLVANCFEKTTRSLRQK